MAAKTCIFHMQNVTLLCELPGCKVTIARQKALMHRLPFLLLAR